MELFAQYISERLDQGIVDIPGQGFATFQITGFECYIVDIFVIPELRKTGLAKQMADKITQIAKEKGCTTLKGTVQTNTNNSKTSEAVLLAYGMRFEYSLPEKSLKVFKKDI